MILDRDTLGANGHAIYQVDFFVPAAPQRVPSLAVIAMEPLPANAANNMPLAFYRWGTLANRDLYFSYVNTRPGAQATVPYSADTALFKRVPKPGWHRLALVFEGPEKIRCFIDGNEPKFSPINDKTLRKLQVGVLQSDPKFSYDAYIDNLSIQWTAEDVALPASPYAAGWPPAPAAAASGQTVAKAAAKPAEPKSAESRSNDIQWAEPGDAWQETQRSKRPLLFYFTATGFATADRLDSILATDSRAKTFLDAHCRSRIDVNQLMGGRIAQRYGIFKVPTFLIVSPDSKELARVTFGKDDTWDTLRPTPGGEVGGSPAGFTSENPDTAASANPTPAVSFIPCIPHLYQQKSPHAARISTCFPESASR